MHYTGNLYRALNPLWARTPLSGAGAARFGGRFNPKGMPALYTSLRPETAMREANQAGPFQPITLVAYQAELGGVFDAMDTAALAGMSLRPEQLADPGWRDAMLAGDLPPTHRLALDLKEQGYVGIRVPSFVPMASAGDHNLVLWVWGDVPSTLLRVIDDQGRLTY